MNPRLIVILVLLCHAAFSQEQKITVRILESGTEKPIKDANVTIPGTSNGTFSNHLGYFELAIDRAKHTSLQISHIGYKIFQVAIPAQDRFKLYLQKDTVTLNPVNLNTYPKAEEATENKGDASLNESEAVFPGGMEKFYSYLGNTLAPALPDITGRGFSILFTIDENGQPTDVIISDPGSNIQTTVSEAFQKMPVWIPATQRQKNVREMFRIIVNRFDSQAIDTKSLLSFITRNIKYPAPARRLGIEGAIYVRFTADESGKVLDINLLTQLDASCNLEATRIASILPTNIIKSLSAQTQQYEFILPIFFSLDQGNVKKENQVAPKTSAFVISPVTIMAGGLTVQRREIHGSSSMRSVEEITYETLIEALKKGNGVKKLALNSNQLSTFPSEILTLKNLFYLDLGNNQIQLLPNEIDALQNLKEFYLLQNQLKSLPDNFVNLQKLEKLDLTGNKFSTFPIQLFKLDKLETLDLTNNQLTSLPPEIGLLKNLKTLILVNNNITSLPPEFFTLKKLEKIYLEGNQINANDLELLKKTYKKASLGY